MEQEVLEAHGASKVQSVASERFHSWKLYGYWRSSCSWRVRIALAAKGIKYKSKVSFADVSCSNGQMDSKEWANAAITKGLDAVE
eukprot:753519-Hanusia_phi.AAC.2